jgi:hypothetical protein
MPFWAPCHWVVSTRRLHARAPQRIQKNKITTHCGQKFGIDSYKLGLDKPSVANKPFGIHSSLV